MKISTIVNALYIPIAGSAACYFGQSGVSIKQMRIKRLPFFLPAFGFFLVFVFTACKRPHADFTTDKFSYKGGETVHLKSNAKNARSYKWYVNNELAGETKDLDYILDAGASGDVPIRLEAFRKNRSATATRFVSVEPLTGTLTVWSSNTPQDIEISKPDFRWVGQLFFPYTGDPGCEAAGCVYGEMPVGVYTVHAAGFLATTISTVQVLPDSCVRFRVP